MSEKTLKNLVGLLGGLVVLYGLVTLVTGGDGGGSGALGTALAGIDPGTVDAVRFDGDAGAVELRRGESGWSVNGRPADSASVDRLWSAVEDAAAAQVVSTNPDNHANLGVSADNATSLEILRDGETAVRLLIGDNGPYRPSAYVRLADRDPVGLAEGQIRTLAGRDIDSWRDRTVVRLDTAAVERVRVEREDGGYTVERGGGEWTVDGEPAAARAVLDLLGELASLEASGFAPEDAAFEASSTLTALGGDADTLAVLRIQPAGGQGEASGSPGAAAPAAASARIRLPDAATVYEVPGWRADRLTPEPASLMPDGG